MEGFRVGLTEFLDDVFAYFVAVLANRGADGCDEVCRGSLVGFVHGFYGAFASFLRPAPSQSGTDQWL